MSLSDVQVAQLYRHYEMLLRWNQRMNLTTVRPGPDIVIRHYCESLFFAAHIPRPNEQISVLDLGSGAGFPGIAVAVLRPEWRILLVESSTRKSVFLRESSRHLENVSVLTERMEDTSIHGDWAVARAVNPVEVLRNIPRLAPNVALMIGEDNFSLIVRSPERSRTSEYDFHIAWSDPVRLPWGDRRFCVYGKCST